jgi:hypothetical protein
LANLLYVVAGVLHVLMAECANRWLTPLSISM